MSMMSTIESGNGWELQENMVMDEVWLVITNSDKAAYVASSKVCKVKIPSAAIDALRAMQPRFLPHLRQQRAAVFSERARKGWATRRGENKAQRDADIKTLINMESK